MGKVCNLDKSSRLCRLRAGCARVGSVSAVVPGARSIVLSCVNAHAQPRPSLAPPNLRFPPLSLVGLQRSYRVKRNLYVATAEHQLPVLSRDVIVSA